MHFERPLRLSQFLVARGPLRGTVDADSTFHQYSFKRQGHLARKHETN